MKSQKQLIVYFILGIALIFTLVFIGKANSKILP